MREMREVIGADDSRKPLGDISFQTVNSRAIHANSAEHGGFNVVHWYVFCNNKKVCLLPSFALTRLSRKSREPLPSFIPANECKVTLHTIPVVQVTETFFPCAMNSSKMWLSKYVFPIPAFPVINPLCPWRMKSNARCWSAFNALWKKNNYNQHTCKWARVHRTKMIGSIDK